MKDMAIGMNMIDFAVFSKELRSASTATIKPSETDSVVPIKTHKILFRIAICSVRSVNTAK
ncbi:hypothetical protein D3C71_2017280 [compost metagenome]